MEGVVRVSSADTNDRRNRWETGNGGRGGGAGKKRARARIVGPTNENDRKRTNPPTPLSFSFPSWALPPTGGATATLHVPPTPRWKSWTNREGAFPATNDPQLHPRSSLCNVFSSDFVRILLRKATFFPRFFSCTSINRCTLTDHFNRKVKVRFVYFFFFPSFCINMYICVYIFLFRRVHRTFTKIPRSNSVQFKYLVCVIYLIGGNVKTTRVGILKV